jgi:hypothetical protein
MMNKKLVNVVAAVGVMLGQAAAAHAACTGPKDPVFSTCGNGATGGEMHNGFILSVDLATGTRADGRAFAPNGDQIFVCATRDTIQGLGNQSNTATFQCSSTVATVQVSVI